MCIFPPFDIKIGPKIIQCKVSTGLMHSAGIVETNNIPTKWNRAYSKRALVWEWKWLWLPEAVTVKWRQFTSYVNEPDNNTLMKSRRCNKNSTDPIELLSRVTLTGHDHVTISQSVKTRRHFNEADRISDEPPEERVLFKNDDTEDKTDVSPVAWRHMKCQVRSETCTL